MFINETPWTFALGLFISFITILANLIIPIVYRAYPETREYPNIIMVLMCVTQVFQIYIYTVGVCFAYSEGYQVNHIEGRYLYTIFAILLYLQEALIMAWCIDIILTIQHPICRAKKRKIFLPMFVVSFVTINILLLSFQDSKALELDQSQYSFFIVNVPTDNLGGYFLMGNQMIYSTLLFMTDGVILCKLQKVHKQTPSIPKTIQQNFLITQTIMITTLMIMQEMLIYMSLFSVQYIKSVSVVLIYSQGIFLSIPRLRDKYFREKFKCLLSCKKKHTGTCQLNDWNIPLSNLFAKVSSQEVMGCMLFGMEKILLENANKHERVKSFDSHIQSLVTGDSLEVVNRSQYSTESQQFIQENSIKMKVLLHIPHVFQLMRSLGNIQAHDIQSSLNMHQNYNAIKEMSESLGRSGAFFLETHDQQFVIKTITQKEKQIIIDRFGDSYAEHFRQNPNSLLARIYGCFTINIENVHEVSCILMENSFRMIGSPQKVYDVKGSIYKRRSSQSAKVQKDLNLMDEMPNYFQLSFEDTKKIVNLVQIDTEYLQNKGIMDYSMLIGISHKEIDLGLQEEEDNFNSRDLKEPKRMLSFTIIDYLQEYDLNKKLEGFLKMGKKEISSVPPERYKERFCQFIDRVLGN